MEDLGKMNLWCLVADIERGRLVTGYQPLYNGFCSVLWNINTGESRIVRNFTDSEQAMCYHENQIAHDQIKTGKSRNEY